MIEMKRFIFHGTCVVCTSQELHGLGRCAGCKFLDLGNRKNQPDLSTKTVHAVETEKARDMLRARSKGVTMIDTDALKEHLQQLMPVGVKVKDVKFCPNNPPFRTHVYRITIAPRNGNIQLHEFDQSTIINEGLKKVADHIREKLPKVPELLKCPRGGYLTGQYIDHDSLLDWLKFHKYNPEIAELLIQELSHEEIQGEDQ